MRRTSLQLRIFEDSKQIVKKNLVTYVIKKILLKNKKTMIKKIEIKKSVRSNLNAYTKIRFKSILE